MAWRIDAAIVIPVVWVHVSVICEEGMGEKVSGIGIDLHVESLGNLYFCFRREMFPYVGSVLLPHC